MAKIALGLLGKNEVNMEKYILRTLEGAKSKKYYWLVSVVGIWKKATNEQTCAT